MTMFEDNGFLLGPKAFSTREETVKTVFQEMYRLRMSSIAGVGYPGGASGPVASETFDASDFADRAFQAISHHF